MGIKSDGFLASAKNYISGGEKSTMEELDARISTISLLGRSGGLEDVVGLVSFIASPEAQWMTGQTSTVAAERIWRLHVILY